MEFKILYVYRKKEMGQPTIDFVITRFEEDLSWVNQLPKFYNRVLIYNKGSPAEFNIPDSQVHIVPNYGMDGFVNLTHVINNYDTLADITFFSLGSAWARNDKRVMFVGTLHFLMKTGGSSIINVVPPSLIKETYDFTLDTWAVSNPENFDKNPETSLVPSDIRPLGAWFATYFPGEHITCVSHLGIFAATSTSIRKRPVEFYKTLLEQVLFKNTEVAHYLERVWKNVFSIDDACVYSPF